MTIEQKCRIKQLHIDNINAVLANYPIKWEDYFRKKSLALIHIIDLLSQGEITQEECIEISNAIAATF